MRPRTTRLVLDALEERLATGASVAPSFQPSGLSGPTAFFRGAAGVPAAVTVVPAASRPTSPFFSAGGELVAPARLVIDLVVPPGADVLAETADPTSGYSAVSIVSSLPPDGVGDNLATLRQLEPPRGVERPNRGLTTGSADSHSTPQNSLGSAAADAGPGAAHPGDPVGGPVLSVSQTPDRFQQDLWVVAGSQQGPLVADGLDIPDEHPRLWFTPDRLEYAQKQFAKYSFDPRQDPLNNALVYLMTGDSANAAVAINALMNFTIPQSELDGVASDTYRWSDWVPVVYDWCHDAMTASQRNTFRQRYDGYVDIMMNKPWGGPGLEANNYYWGYFRNELNWGIAIYGEDARAQTYLNHALVTRWQNSFLPYARTAGLGGVPVEGTQYGAYTLAYPVIPLTTAGLLGRDLYDETNYFKEAALYTIYATSPTAVQRKDDTFWYPQVFPFADDDTYDGYPAATSSYLGDFMSTVAQTWPDTALGQYARHWLNTVNADTSWFTALTDSGGKELDFSSLPTDYYAPGPGYFYTRDAWDNQATSVFLQLGQGSAASHLHYDAGSFQIIRGDQYLSKATSGYGLTFNGGTSTDTIAQNDILFNGLGHALNSQDGPPRVLRVQSDENFSYVAVDLTPAYRAHGSPHPERDDNPYAGSIVREFIYVKPLQTLFVLDRLQASSDAIPASQVQKTFVLHFPQEPEVEGDGSILGVNGDQALHVTPLGQQPGLNVVDEGAFDGHHEASSFYQYRLEESLSGQPQSYFMNVIQARDVKGDDVVSNLTQDANSWTITLDHPTLGHAVIVLNKGLTSTGGWFGFDPKGTPDTLTPLLDHVQGIQVTDDGPVWES